MDIFDIICYVLAGVCLLGSAYCFGVYAGWGKGPRR